MLSKDLHICTLEEGGVLEMELQARIGRGYVSADTNKQLYQTPNQPLGIIYTDSIYTPIEKVSYSVDPTRVVRMHTMIKLLWRYGLILQLVLQNPSHYLLRF